MIGAPLGGAGDYQDKQYRKCARVLPVPNLRQQRQQRSPRRSVLPHLSADDDLLMASLQQRMGAVQEARARGSWSQWWWRRTTGARAPAGSSLMRQPAHDRAVVDEWARRVRMGISGDCGPFSKFHRGGVPGRAAHLRAIVPAAGRRRFPLSLFFPRGTRVARAAAGRGGRRRGV